MKYRAEIDGLRALAVLPVILFHAGFEWFSGGFVGVDVFFVISGYLITTIIISEMAEGKFSIVNFYERRARRILPALFFVMAVCLPFAWLWLPPTDLKDFGQSLVAVSTFSSNILFWRESGYFDTTAELKPLLHTWSLAVEEQFYILFPLFLIVTWRFGVKLVVILLCVTFTISLGLAHWGAYNAPNSAFFLLPARGWELLVGVFIAFWLKTNPYFSSSLINQVLSFLGLVMILCSISFFDDGIPFPSFYALAPTIGTGLVILCAVPKTVAHKLLSHRLMVAVGLISYSAYLWHQPILAFARHRWSVNLELAALLGICVASLMLAWISWRFVEKPFRERGNIKRPTVFIFSLVGILMFSIIGLRFHITGGEISRLDAELFSHEKVDLIGYHHSQLKADTCHNREVITMPACVIGDDQSPQFAVVGDSHAYTLVDSLRKELSYTGTPFIQYTKNGCPPSVGLIDDESNGCKGFMDAVQKDLATKSVETVILFGRWAYYVAPSVYENGMGGREVRDTNYSVIGTPFSATEITRRLKIISAYIEFIELLVEQGKKVIVIGAVPEHGWSVPSQIAKSFLISGHTQVKNLPKSVYDQRVSFLKPFYEYLRASNVKFVDPTPIFCGDDAYCAALSEDGVALYWDGDHLSNSGARLIIRQLVDESLLVQ